MRAILLSVCCLLFGMSVLSAKIWTVDNRPGANFQSLSAAQTAASAGDTILIAGSASSYAGLTISKTLVIIGPGYFLTENTGLQANTESARVGQLTISATAPNTVISGLQLPNGISISGANVILERCYLTGTTGGGGVVRLEGNQSNAILRQNFIVSTGSSVITLGGTGSASFYNNYFETTVSVSPPSGQMFNNVFYGNLTIANLEFNNNIQGSGSFSTSGSTLYNNIGNSTQFGTSNGNLSSVIMSSVFVGTGSTDGKWQIVGAGPADNTGFAGVDCGMYDTSAGRGYRLSGIPSIPTVYEFSANGDLSSVTVKVRTNP